MGCVCCSDSEKSKKAEMRIEKGNNRLSVYSIKGNIESNVIDNRSLLPVVENSNINPHNPFNLNGIYLHADLNKNFDFPEIDKEVYMGEGIKRMKAYKSLFDIQEMKKKRKEFWETRIEGDKHIWELLRVCCEELDENDILLYFEAAGIKPYANCINRCYDSKGFLYEIPNYCINNPYQFELEFIKKKSASNKEVSLLIRHFSKEILIMLRDSETISNVKDKISKESTEILQRNHKKEDISLYYGGHELKNEYSLVDYNINSKCIIQMNIKGINDSLVKSLCK